MYRSRQRAAVWNIKIHSQFLSCAAFTLASADFWEAFILQCLIMVKTAKYISFAHCVLFWKLFLIIFNGRWSMSQRLLNAFLLKPKEGLVQCSQKSLKILPWLNVEIYWNFTEPWKLSVHCIYMTVIYGCYIHVCICMHTISYFHIYIHQEGHKHILLKLKKAKHLIWYSPKYLYGPQPLKLLSNIYYI